MSDERLHKLGTYFVHFNIGSRYSLTFEEFVGLNVRGEWVAWKA